uniref:Uncharacterized protein n=1 Tax=Medicago truncatula TaxID=3880 RepID=A2Q5U3_MEDTR|nr:hypothetical protein MtrDRAFT_AC169177g11v1 [Medicago truncatula]
MSQCSVVCLESTISLKFEAINSPELITSFSYKIDSSVNTFLSGISDLKPRHKIIPAIKVWQFM